MAHLFLKVFLGVPWFYFWHSDRRHLSNSIIISKQYQVSIKHRLCLFHGDWVKSVQFNLIMLLQVVNYLLIRKSKGNQTLSFIKHKHACLATAFTDSFTHYRGLLPRRLNPWSTGNLPRSTVRPLLLDCWGAQGEVLIHRRLSVYLGGVDKSQARKAWEIDQLF